MTQHMRQQLPHDTDQERQECLVEMKLVAAGNRKNIKKMCIIHHCFPTLSVLTHTKMASQFNAR